DPYPEPRAARLRARHAGARSGAAPRGADLHRGRGRPHGGRDGRCALRADPPGAGKGLPASQLQGRASAAARGHGSAARPQPEQGRVRVTPALEVPEHPNIYVIGDAAYLEVNGAPLPMMAPVAIQMAETAAANIRRRIAGATPVAFVYRDPGSLATIGRNAAVA